MQSRMGATPRMERSSAEHPTLDNRGARLQRMVETYGRQWPQQRFALGFRHCFPWTAEPKV